MVRETVDVGDRTSAFYLRGEGQKGNRGEGSGVWCVVYGPYRMARVQSAQSMWWWWWGVCVCVYVYARAHMCMWWVLMDTGGGNPPHSGMTNPPPHLSSPCSSAVHDQAQWFVAIITGQPHQALLDNPRRQPQALGHTAQQGCLASRRVAKDVLLQHHQCTGVRVKHDITVHTAVV